MKNHEWKIHPRDSRNLPRHQDLSSARVELRSGFKFAQTSSLKLRPVEGFIWEDRRFLPPHQQPCRNRAIPLATRSSHFRLHTQWLCKVILICQRDGQSQSSNANTVGEFRRVASWKLDKQKTTDAEIIRDLIEMYFVIRRPAPFTRDSWLI